MATRDIQTPNFRLAFIYAGKGYLFQTGVIAENAEEARELALNEFARLEPNIKPIRISIWKCETDSHV